MFIPVVNQNNEPLMPTIPSRARRWIRSGKATPFWKQGLFCVRLNIKTEENKQEIAVGIDPGSKREAFTVKSKAHTYLNIQTKAVDWVKKAIEIRRIARKRRRYRETPCRQPKENKSRTRLAPSTRARWQWKLRILNWLKKVFPIIATIVEDIKVKTTGKPGWDKSFSPLEVGKNWFYDQIPNLTLKQGRDTKVFRDAAGLNKSKSKLSDDFSAHCVDSWVLANWRVGGHQKPDNSAVLLIEPIRFHRRQLHYFQYQKNGTRPPYGGTHSMGLKRGSLILHPKYGSVYVGGTSGDRISLLSVSTGIRLCRNIKPDDCKFRTYLAWRIRWRSTGRSH